MYYCLVFPYHDEKHVFSFTKENKKRACVCVEEENDFIPEVRIYQNNHQASM